MNLKPCFFCCLSVLNGSWFDHVLNWWKNKDDLNVLFIKYEEIKKVTENTHCATFLN